MKIAALQPEKFSTQGGTRPSRWTWSSNRDTAAG